MLVRIWTFRIFNFNNLFRIINKNKAYVALVATTFANYNF